MSQNRFRDKVVIVTGASRGIGKEIALRYHAEGASVIGCARTAKEQLGAIPFQYMEMDLRSNKSVKNFVSQVHVEHKQIDIVVNNAAIPGKGGLQGISEDQWHEVLDVNLKGAVFLSKYCIPHMNSGSSMLMIASIIGVKVSSEKLLYSISKAALIMFTKCIAYELGPLGIRANVILPSITPTKFRKNDFYVSEHLTEILESTPLKQLCSPKDIVNAAMFLTSEDAKFITGVALPVDGGRIL